MTTAVSELLKQAEALSAAERMELAAKLREQARQNAEAAPPVSAEESDGDAEEDDDWLDGFSFRPVPPIDSYVIKVRFVDAGLGEPQRYDFGDLFDDDDEEEDEEAPLK